MHKIPLTDIEREGLKKHGLAVDKPSRLSDSFRLGVAWATEQGKLDTARLEFMQFYGAQVRWGNDSEVCNVWWHTHWGEQELRRTPNHHDWRAAIDEAIELEKKP